MERKFHFYVDQKVTAWYRTDFGIVADNVEDARKQAIELVKKHETEAFGWGVLHDTVRVLTPDENNGQSTAELYHEYGDLVYTNQTDEKNNQLFVNQI